MASIITVTATVAEATEDTPEKNIKLLFASQKVALEVRNQLEEQGYTDAKAQIVKDLS